MGNGYPVGLTEFKYSIFLLLFSEQEYKLFYIQKCFINKENNFNQYIYYMIKIITTALVRPLTLRKLIA